VFWSRKKALAPLPPVRTSKAFEPLDEFRHNFSIAGTICRERCPICAGPDIARLWQLPQSRLGSPTYLNSPGAPFHDLYLDYLPLLRVPQEIFIFDVCRFCHSIFRNPRDDDQTSYRNDTSKVAAFKAKGTAPFAGIVKVCEKHFPPNTRTVVDAACGGGQALAAMRSRHAGLKLTGLELSGPSVDYMRSLGIDAHVVDLDFEELDDIVGAGTVDFILFYEAFEHVREPLVVLRKLVRMLRSGGRLHFTAQYYGAETSLQVRVGEPIYIDRHGLDWILSNLEVRLHAFRADTKFRVTLERR
jgi:SAM-dependent methyltransferase